MEWNYVILCMKCFHNLLLSYIELNRSTACIEVFVNHHHQLRIVNVDHPV